jgi:hypothetical protein
MKNVGPKAFLIISSTIQIFSLWYSISFFMGNTCSFESNAQQIEYVLVCLPAAIFGPLLSTLLFSIALYQYGENKKIESGGVKKR